LAAGRFQSSRRFFKPLFIHIFTHFQIFFKILQDSLKFSILWRFLEIFGDFLDEKNANKSRGHFKTVSE